jgi:hypothetical protein
MKTVLWMLIYLAIIGFGTVAVVAYAVSRGYSSMAELSADLPSIGKLAIMLVCTIIATAMILATKRALDYIHGRQP